MSGLKTSEMTDPVRVWTLLQISVAECQGNLFTPSVEGDMTFKLGDLVIGQNFTAPFTKRNGMEGEIIEVGPTLTFGLRYQKHTKADYGVKWADGEIRYCDEPQLRKKQPPDDQLFTRWFNETIITDPIAVPLEETMRRVHPALREINRGS